MLDLELVTPPTENGLDVLSLDQAKRHLRIVLSNTTFDDELSEIIVEVGDKLHGRGGELNRTIFPTTWRRYIRCWPGRHGAIKLPYPPTLSVGAITYDDGSSPLPDLDAGSYVVRTPDLITEISLVDWRDGWPTLNGSVHPRAVSVTYTAGYEEYPPVLRRMMKIMVGHYFENKEATINESKSTMVNRAVLFGMEDARAALKIPSAYDDWE